MRNSLLSTTAVTGLVALLAVRSAPADAATVYHSVSATSSGQDWNGGGLQIPTFDSNDGTLKSVMVFEKLTANYNGTATVTGSGASYSGSAAFQSVLSISSGPSVLDGASILTVTGSAPIGVVPGTTYQYSSTGNSTQSGPNSYTSNLGQWTSAGPGTTAITLTSLTNPLNSYPPGMSTMTTPDLKFTVDVTYSYTGTSTPEPASALMLGAGVIGLGAARRRRKRKSVQG